MTGWWHDSRFLAATGKGLETEEGRAWEGWWNEKIVSLVELSAKQKDALTILLTGRSVRGYSNLIKRMVTSKNLDFDIITLKPETGPNAEHLRSTIFFKCMFLEDVLNTYNDVEEVRYVIVFCDGNPATGVLLKYDCFEEYTKIE